MFQPNFTISPEVLNAISEIASIKTIVERSRVLPLNELQLKRQALIRMVHTSTSIEGNKLAEHQVGQVLSGMAIAADDQSIREVKNYQDAVREIEDLASKKTQITKEIILGLHATVMRGLLEEKKTGHLRPGDIFIVDELGSGREKLRFQGPPAKQISFLIDDLLKWLKKADKDDFPPIIKAGIFHSQFVHIHPFTDGNGRLARLLTTLILYRDDWDFRKVIVLEEFYNQNRQDYYNGLAYGWDEKYHEDVDFTPWLEYFVAGFLIEARKVKNIITSLGFDKIKSLKQAYLDPDEVKIMDLVTTANKITSDDITNLLKVAKRTAQLKLKNLVEKGLIKPQAKGPATYYIPA